ncbi:hypothetical protein JB92DRAFT_2991562 [Gautieria morchelliformis]|nr:hypothetical protein JB92DRAFT_2991562 [Gautieria morchelliformis]
MALVNLQPTYGSLFLGVVTSVGLMGITTLQAWLYWNAYGSKDSLRTKLMVATVWTLEFLRVCFAVHAVYHYLVLEWGNPKALASSIWSVDINLIITAFIQLIVHCYFAYRVKVLSGGNWYMVSLIGFFAFGNWAMTIATYGATIAADTFSKIQAADNLPGNFATAALSCAIAADVSITVFLLYCLNRYREAHSPSLSLINRLMVYSVNVGILTSLSDIAVLVLSDGPLHGGLQYYAMYEVVGNFYANSLLGTLNARESVRKIRPDVAMSSGPPTLGTFPRDTVVFVHQTSAATSRTVEDSTKMELQDLSSQSSK